VAPAVTQPAFHPAQLSAARLADAAGLGSLRAGDVLCPGSAGVIKGMQICQICTVYLPICLQLAAAFGALSPMVIWAHRVGADEGGGDEQESTEERRAAMRLKEVDWTDAMHAGRWAAAAACEREIDRLNARNFAKLSLGACGGVAALLPVARRHLRLRLSCVGSTGDGESHRQAVRAFLLEEDALRLRALPRTSILLALGARLARQVNKAEKGLHCTVTGHDAVPGAAVHLVTRRACKLVAELIAEMNATLAAERNAKASGRGTPGGGGGVTGGGKPLLAWPWRAWQYDGFAMSAVIFFSSPSAWCAEEAMALEALGAADEGGALEAGEHDIMVRACELCAYVASKHHLSVAELAADLAMAARGRTGGSQAAEWELSSWPKEARGAWLQPQQLVGRLCSESACGAPGSYNRSWAGPPKPDKSDAELAALTVRRSTPRASRASTRACSKLWPS
jgi:hypothetical protein